MNYRIIHKPTTHSTNNDVKVFFESNEPEGLVIAADHQTAGRGRNGAWKDDSEGMLLMSLLLRPECSLDDYLQLNYWAGQAVIHAVQAQSSQSLQLSIKWPNDVLLSGRKICGVLQEGSLHKNRLKVVALGIGLNVTTSQSFFDRAVLDQATSLLIAHPQVWDKERLMRDILQHFSVLYLKVLSQT